MLNNPTQELQELLKFYQQQIEKPITLMEAAEYTQLSKSYLYKLTHSNKIPFAKPSGKKLYFLKSELNQWMMQNRNKTESELEQIAISHVMFGGR